VTVANHRRQGVGLLALAGREALMELSCAVLAEWVHAMAGWMPG
jgi:hypothetical protein